MQDDRGVYILHAVVAEPCVAPSGLLDSLFEIFSTCTNYFHHHQQSTLHISSLSLSSANNCLALDHLLETLITATRKMYVLPFFSLIQIYRNTRLTRTAD